MNILRETRKTKGLTLVEIDAALGIDTGNMSRIERGVQIPSLKIARQLAKYYSLTLEEVFGVEEEEEHCVIGSALDILIKGDT